MHATRLYMHKAFTEIKRRGKSKHPLRQRYFKGMSGKNKMSSTEAAPQTDREAEGVAEEETGKGEIGEMIYAGAVEREAILLNTAKLDNIMTNIMRFTGQRSTTPHLHTTHQRVPTHLDSQTDKQKNNPPAQ